MSDRPELAAEDPAIRLRRLRMRAWRRGTREMDLILGGFADNALQGLSARDVAAFDALLEENDHDLYRWISQRVPGVVEAPPAGVDDLGQGSETSAPAAYASLLERIAAHTASHAVARPPSGSCDG